MRKDSKKERGRDRERKTERRTRNEDVELWTKLGNMPSGVAILLL